MINGKIASVGGCLELFTKFASSSAVFIIKTGQSGLDEGL